MRFHVSPSMSVLTTLAGLHSSAAFSASGQKLVASSATAVFSAETLPTMTR